MGKYDWLDFVVDTFGFVVLVALSLGLMFLGE